MRASGRFLALLLVLLTAFGVFATAALAAGEEGAAAAGPEQTAAPVVQTEQAPQYVLREETVITEDDTPLAAVPTPDMFVEHDCCILHFVLMLAALGVSVYYVHDRKVRQEREFEVRSEL